ncbi:hypothetical protein ACO0QE_000862 [Hanseniaspora vineae]
MCCSSQIDDNLDTMVISSSPPRGIATNKEDNVCTNKEDNQKTKIYSEPANEIQTDDMTFVPSSYMDKTMGHATSETNTLPSVSDKKSIAASTQKQQQQSSSSSSSNSSPHIALCQEYQKEIYAHLYQRETTTHPVINYCKAELKQQCKQYLRPSMRAILVDWLVQVHESFRLFPETLYLGVQIMDRFMALKKVSLSKLQLLAITSLFIAAKYEEVVLPKLEKYTYMTDNAYTDQQLKDAEMFILNTLEFDIVVTNHFNFLRQYNSLDNYNVNYRLLGKYYMEYSTMCHWFIDEKDSVKAMMGTVLAKMMYKIKDTSFYASENGEPSSQEESSQEVSSQEVSSQEDSSTDSTSQNSSPDKSIWGKDFIKASNGLDPVHDSSLQRKIWLLINEIHKPTTTLKALDNKYNSSSLNYAGPVCKKWCTEIVEMVNDDYSVLFL